MTYYFAAMAEGLGDLLITLPALKSVIDSGVPTILVLRSPKQEGVAELIEGLAGTITEPEFLAIELKAEDRFINLRNHPFQLTNFYGSDEFFSKFGRINIIDICEIISQDLIERDLGIKADCKTFVPFPFVANQKALGKVLLVPGSAGGYKCWYTDKWLELIALLSERGLSCAVLGQPERSSEVEDLIGKGVQWLATPTISDAVSAVSSALGMITVDTGLMHLAVQQLCPTVSLHQMRSVYARKEEHCRPIFSPDCSIDCQNKTFVPPNLDVVFREYHYMQFLPCFAKENERCMEQIQASTVFEQFVDLLGSAKLGKLAKASI